MLSVDLTFPHLGKSLFLDVNVCAQKFFILLLFTLSKAFKIDMKIHPLWRMKNRKVRKIFAGDVPTLRISFYTTLLPSKKSTKKRKKN